MVVIPLIFTSIASGISNLRAHTQMARVWKIALVYFMTTSALAILLGLVVINVFPVGQGLESPPFQESVTQLPFDRISLAEFFREFVSRLFLNPFSAMADGKILPTVIFAIFMGAAMVVVGEKGDGVSQLLREGFEIIMVITHWIMRLAPLGVMALFITLIATQDLRLIKQMAMFVGIVFLATGIHGFVTLPLILRLFTRVRPLHFFRCMQDALITAFSTSSSSAALPVTLEAVEERLEVDKDVAGFVLPLGATINMDGTALYEAIAALFIANVVGIELNLIEQLIIFLMTAVAAVGAPGIPSAGMTTMIMVLESVGLPAEGVIILLPLDRLLDTIRTAVNVEGDAIGCCVIHEILHKK